MVRGPVSGSGRALVVCVDDQPEVLRSLKRLLWTEPYDLLLTDHPKQVLQWVHDRPVDLVLADHLMAEMDGVRLLKAVQESSPSTTCVLASGVSGMAHTVAESTIEVAGLVSKPWDNNLLKQLVRNLLEDRSVQAEKSGSPNDSSLPRPADAFKADQVWVDCATKCTREVIAEAFNACEPVRLDGMLPVLHLRNTKLLEDSLTRLLKSLLRASNWFDLRIDVQDDTGYAGAFAEALSVRREQPKNFNRKPKAKTRPALI
jgi:CheY-like chemotaxis protein